MNFLEEKILKDGVIKQGNVLKIDNFLNHQIDINIIRQIASELKRRFHDVQVNKILTIEASGIAIATMLLSSMSPLNGKLIIVYDEHERQQERVISYRG